MKKNYFEPQVVVMQLQGAMNQCEVGSPVAPPVLNNNGGSISTGHLE